MKELPNPTFPLSPLVLPRGVLHRPDRQPMGARLKTPLAGHDVELFDNYCEHLLVRDQTMREVIGTYRVRTLARYRKHCRGA